MPLPTDKVQYSTVRINLEFSADAAQQPTQAEVQAYADEISEDEIQKATTKFLDDPAITLTGVTVDIFP